ncbi:MULTISPECIES: hypothetical protein [unclassified Streptomyces]|uniref:hypothetical protein n=1 Tax=unclassified Streptomyces TaxID=2593676 RepID=UPI0006ADFB39|nr:MULTISPECIES: hypothetical protein [unclassified Streptomyces]
MLTLFTNRFPDFQTAQGVPVRITRGHPRYKLSYLLQHQVPVLAPAAAYFTEPEPVFTAAYRADLDKLGAPRIAELLNAVATAAGDHRLVLLCFEDLSKPGLWCHRRVFADWWQERTGDVVRELGPRPTHEQIPLM